MMLDISGAVPNILTRLKKMSADTTLELLTFKRDRGVRIAKNGDDAFIATEFGFHAESYDIDLKGMKKLLKTVLKREFPRSNKIRVKELQR